jgi:hypothetical protein
MSATSGVGSVTCVGRAAPLRRDDAASRTKRRREEEPMSATSSAAIDRFVALAREAIDGLDIRHDEAGPYVAGPHGRVSLQEMGGQVALSAALSLCVGQPAFMDESPADGDSDMEHWAELSDAACAWEDLGFELEQPGAFSVVPGGDLCYDSTARGLVSPDAGGVQVLGAALGPGQTLFLE